MKELFDVAISLNTEVTTMTDNKQEALSDQELKDREMAGMSMYRNIYPYSGPSGKPAHVPFVTRMKVLCRRLLSKI